MPGGGPGGAPLPAGLAAAAVAEGSSFGGPVSCKSRTYIVSMCKRHSWLEIKFGILNGNAGMSAAKPCLKVELHTTHTPDKSLA